MFSKLTEEIETALHDLRRVRAGAQRKGFPLEEINIRILHLESCLKKLRGAHEDFLKSLGGFDDVDDDADERGEP